jgi:hypothetical protein
MKMKFAADFRFRLRLSRHSSFTADLYGLGGMWMNWPPAMFVDALSSIVGLNGGLLVRLFDDGLEMRADCRIPAWSSWTIETSKSFEQHMCGHLGI